MNNEIGQILLTVGATALVVFIADYIWIGSKLKKIGGSSENQVRALAEKIQEATALRKKLEEAENQIVELENRAPAAAGEVDTTLYVQRMEELTAQIQVEKEAKLRLEQQIAGLPNASGEAELLRHRVEHLENEIQSTSSRADQAELLVKELQEAATVNAKSGGDDEAKAQLLTENEHLRKLVQNMRTHENELEELNFKIRSLEEALSKANTLNDAGSGADTEELTLQLAKKDQQIEMLMKSKAQLDSEKIQLEQAFRDAMANFKDSEELQHEREQLLIKLNESKQELESVRNVAKNSELYLAKFESAQDALERLKADLAERDEQLAGQKNIFEEAQAYQAQWEEGQAEIKALEAKVSAFQTASTEGEGLQSALQESQLRLHALESELAEKNAQIEELQLATEQTGDHLRKHEEAQAEIANLSELLEKAQAEAQEAVEAQSRTNARSNELQNQLREKHAEFLALQKDTEAQEQSSSEKFEAEIARLKNLLTESENQADEAAEREASLSEKIEALAAELDSTKRESQEARSSLGEIRSEADQVRTELSKVQEEANSLSEAARRLEEAEEEIEQLRKHQSEQGEAAAEIDPMRKRINELFAHLEDSRRENEGIRKSMEGTLSDLRRLRYEMIELGRLREENARLKATRGPSAELDTLRSKVAEADVIVLQSKTETKETKQALETANHEIASIRAQLRTTIDLGELA